MSPGPIDPRCSPASRRGTYRLQNGDHLRSAEFERRFDATPGLKKAELIEGIAYVHEPVRHRDHGGPNAQLVTWLGSYACRTPGTAFTTDATLRLDDENEPQPDGALFIEAERGGQCRIDAEGYLAGAPEFVVEVSASSASYDLHSKLRTYRRAGVREYCVVRMLDGLVDWFRFEDGESRIREGVAGGVLCSEVFPGLWLDVDALLAGDLAALLRRLDEGLATEAHACFVEGLDTGT